MNTKTKQQIEDYTLTLRQMASVAAFPIGAVIVGDQDRNDVLSQMEAGGAAVIKTEGHPDTALEEIIKNIKKGAVVALDIRGELNSKISNQLREISRGRVNVHLVGDSHPTIINPIPKESGVILVLDDTDYTQSSVSSIATSAINLNRV